MLADFPETRAQIIQTYTIALGTMLPAFSTSSAICATESCPSTTNMLDTFSRLSAYTLGNLALCGWLTCPTSTVAPMFGHPAPLSVNCVKTAAALCLVGVMTHRQTITGTKAKKWTLQKIPSARGRCFAQKMLKDATAITATHVNRVPCQRSGVYVASLITTNAWTRPPTICPERRV